MGAPRTCAARNTRHNVPPRVSAKEPINPDELTSERPRRGPLGKTQRYDESRFFVKD